MNRSRWTQAFIAVSVMTIANSAPALAAGTIRCGAVLTANTTLTTDLVGCVGDGLVVGGDGITVNLNGHVVSGDAVEDPSDMGIRVTGHRGVHVTNGILQGFWRGVVFDGSPVGVVTSMTVRQMSRRGIVFVNGSDNAWVVGNSSVDNHASGIAIVTSGGALVSNNRSLRNSDGAGVRLEGATNATVTHNTLNGNSGSDGTGLKQITPPGALLGGNKWGDWSPQGNEIVFAKADNPDARASIWVVHADGSGLREIHFDSPIPCGGPKADPNSRGCFDATWSPDGKQIAFIVNQPSGDGRSVYTANIDGSRLTQLTHGHSGDPDWGTRPPT